MSQQPTTISLGSLSLCSHPLASSFFQGEQMVINQNFELIAVIQLHEINCGGQYPILVKVPINNTYSSLK